METFCQKFAKLFSFILQNNEPKSKIFLMEWGTKHTLTEAVGKKRNSRLIKGQREVLISTNRWQEIN
jgi:hypothetical protein